MCEGASKQTPDLKILPRRDPPPRFEIPGSATAMHVLNFTLTVERLINTPLHGQPVSRSFFSNKFAMQIAHLHDSSQGVVTSYLYTSSQLHKSRCSVVISYLYTSTHLHKSRCSVVISYLYSSTHLHDSRHSDIVPLH